MAENHPFSIVTKPQFTARRGLNGLWFVHLQLPRGLSRRIDGFHSQQAANDWIKLDSAAWLKRMEGGQHD